jgi:hypothetical protein
MRKNPVNRLFFINGGSRQKCYSSMTIRCAKQQPPQYIEKEVFISRNTKFPVITDQDVSILLLA